MPSSNDTHRLVSFKDTACKAPGEYLGMTCQVLHEDKRLDLLTVSLYCPRRMDVVVLQVDKECAERI